jgi:ankyrin repeat protein
MSECMSAMDNQLFSAIFEGRPDDVRQLLMKGANPDAVDEFARVRPIHIAVRLGRTEITKLLLADERVSVDRADVNNQRPLDFARKYQHKELERILLRHINDSSDRYDEYRAYLSSHEFAGLVA